MNESRLSGIIEPLTEILSQKRMVLEGLRERTGMIIAGLTCDSVPIEVLHAIGIIPSRIDCGTGACPCAVPDRSEVSWYDILIVPSSCPFRKRLSMECANVVEFHVTAGYGEEHAAALHESLSGLAGSAGIKFDVDPGRLRSSAGEYNLMRRMVRRISSTRRSKPDLLGNADLFRLFTAAQSLPPSVTAGLLEDISGIMQRSESAFTGRLVPSMVYAGCLADPSVLDEIEEAGCLVAEDDMCCGRRQFDLSFNESSENLYAEILDAYLYKPLCPSVRPAQERFDLLYRMLGDHGIETVIFYTDSCCPSRNTQMEFLRIRLMRSGIDPLVVSGYDAAEKVREYSARSLPA
ncbi:MAG: 2-hydroxyacyl-CoA dehydratase family protein [Spirochaetes bacterium]|jgi:hypothetical protein|nr:2-hydroxyacyl-CoA dehydratase family protein [Spirochaetota bacterium]